MSREEFMEVSSVLPSSGEDCFSVGNDDFSFTTASTSALPPPPESAPGNDEIEIAVDEEKMTALQRGIGSGIGCIEIDDARDEELRPAPWGRTYRIGCDEIEEVRDENISPPPQPPPGTGYDSRRSESEGLVPRIYENWRGNNTFFLRGRMIFGPSLHGLFATVTLIVAPVVIFCAIIGIKLMDDFPNHAGISIIIVAVALTLSDMVLLLFVSGRDPGIVPRYKQLPGIPLKDGDDEPYLIINGRYVELKFCRTCKVYRPPRASHCHICNNCIQNFDHHCPWMSQCVGRQNYGFFYMFIVTTALLSGYMFGFCWIYLVKLKNAEHKSLWKILGKSVPATILTIYTFIQCVIILAFSMFHTFLICINQTTNEYVKGYFDIMVNPYDKGIFSNIREKLFPSPLIKINFRERMKIKTPPPVISLSHVPEQTRSELLDLFLGMIAKKEPATEPTREDVAIGENLAAVEEDAEIERKTVCIDAGHTVNIEDTNDA